MDTIRIKSKEVKCKNDIDWCNNRLQMWPTATALPVNNLNYKVNLNYSIP